MSYFGIPIRNGLPIGLGSVAPLASGGGSPFSPLSLFASGAPGVWYDPSDYGATGTLFQDSAGTTPVTAVEQPVGLMLDKSQGLVASTKGGQMVGVSGSGFDTPSATANQITGDIDIRVQASLVSWTPAAINVFCSRVLTGTTSADSYEFWISTSGVLQLLTVSGTTSTNVASSVAVGFAAGTTNWVRVTWQQSSGFVNFYTSSDGVTWTQNGTANRAGTTSATNAGSRILRVGARTEGSFPLNGTIYRTQIYNGINGTLAVDFNPTLYTSGATYTAATGEVWTITGSNARIVPNGNHAFQATSASRPVLSARYNLLTKTEQFDDAVWAKNGATIAANSAVAPDGSTSADTLIEAATTSAHYVDQSVTTSAVPYTFSVYAKAVTRSWIYLRIADSSGIARVVWFNAASGVIGAVGGGITASIEAAGNGWYKCVATISAALAGSQNPRIGVTNANNVESYTGDGTSGVYIWGASLVQTAQAPAAYQRVNTATDYATTGFLPYLKFDGVDDSMSTNSISFTSTDKMSVFAGVRKLSDAAIGAIVGLSSSPVGNNGAFEVLGPAGAGSTDYRWTTRGTATATMAPTGFAAPITNVLTGIADISADIGRLRINGVQVDTSSSDQGTGNYGNYPLYIGRRGGSSLPFNGQLYSMVIVGKAVTAGELTSTETYVNQKTGAYA
jgi:hypothetical protein